eukprot:snap_masked-scaffold_28-processed-gene-4.4-mRNA-1 protein AED:1.00 eAED:1.00 QI:0/-1/0/0/-1/1/1/0/251
MTDRQKRYIRRDKIKKKEEEERLRREEEAEYFDSSSSEEGAQDETNKDENVQDENVQVENIQVENIQDENIQDENIQDGNIQDGNTARDGESRGAVDEEVPTQAEELGAEDAASAEAEEVPADEEAEEVATPAGEERTAEEAHPLNLVVTGTGSPDRRGDAGGPNISTDELLPPTKSGDDVFDEESSDSRTSDDERMNEGELGGASQRREDEVVTLVESVRPMGVNLVAIPVSESAPRGETVGGKFPPPPS